MFKILCRKFSPPHWSTCCLQISWNLPTGNRWSRALFTWQKKFRLALQLSLLRRSRSKSARASPGQCTQSAPDFIQIGSLLAEL